MANGTLVITATATFSKDNVTDSIAVSGRQLTVVDSAKSAVQQIIGTSYEDIDFSDVTTPRYIMLRNASALYSVDISLDGISSFSTLRPGDPFLLPVPTSTGFGPYQAKATGGSAELDILLVSE